MKVTFPPSQPGSRNTDRPSQRRPFSPPAIHDEQRRSPSRRERVGVKSNLPVDLPVSSDEVTVIVQYAADLLDDLLSS